MGGPLVEVSTLLQAGSCHIQVMDRVAANDKIFSKSLCILNEETYFRKLFQN